MASEIELNCKLIDIFNIFVRIKIKYSVNLK